MAKKDPTDLTVEEKLREAEDPLSASVSALCYRREACTER